MFFGPGRIFFVPGGTKNVGDVPVCFLDPVEIFVWDLHVFVLDPGAFLWTTKLIVSELGFCFLDPCGPCLHKVGGNSIVIGAHIGLDVFGPWSIVSLNLYMLFWTWQRVVGMQMLRQDACKKLLMPGKFGY